MQALALADQGFGSPGYPLVEPAGEDKFVLLNTRNTTELITAGDGLDWHVRALPPPTPEQKARMISPPDAVVALRTPTAMPISLGESGKFRYELVWIDKRRTGTILHRKYVRQLDKASGRPASEFLLSTDVETID
jgi:hypothetical protein